MFGHNFGRKGTMETIRLGEEQSYKKERRITSNGKLSLFRAFHFPCSILTDYVEIFSQVFSTTPTFRITLEGNGLWRPFNFEKNIHLTKDVGLLLLVRYLCFVPFILFAQFSQILSNFFHSFFSTTPTFSNKQFQFCLISNMQSWQARALQMLLLFVEPL